MTPPWGVPFRFRVIFGPSLWSSSTTGASSHPRIRFKDRLDDQQQRRLGDPIPYGRYAQRALPSIRFRYPRPAHCRRPVGLGPQTPLDILQKLLDPSGTSFDVLKADAVYSGFTLVGPGHPVGTLQHIPPVYPVIQGIKPKLRLLLRLYRTPLPGLD
jgi:hypothetical protein